jgi:hypothetical protein
MIKAVSIPALLLIAFLVGLSSALFLIPFWIGPFIAAAKNGNPADWIGFAGNFGAGIMTLVAAIIAWFAVQQQIKFQRAQADFAEESRQRERDAQRAETKFAALIAITQPIHAATGVLHGIKQYLQSTSHNDQVRWTAATDKAVEQLDDTLNHFSLREIANGLQVDDRLNYLMILARLSTIVTLYRKRPGVLDTRATYQMLVVQLEELVQFLRPFDDDLAEVFIRDGGISS